MPLINNERLVEYRAAAYFLKPGCRLTDPAGALDFVNHRGFIFFWPIKGMDLPSLWVAAAGDRPVADFHDDPGHVTWGWKDEALPRRIWYYAKILRRKATFISLHAAPYFYALSNNYGSPEEDYLIAYREGSLTQAAKQVYETLLEKGSLDTLSLRKEARLVNAKESAFNRAMEDLQMDFKIMPVGVSEVGAWRYAYRYDLTTRHMPELAEQARRVGEAEARQKLVELYLASVGATRVQDVNRLFGWAAPLTSRTVSWCLSSSSLVEAARTGFTGTWLALPDLVE
jgi:hypothetical protein